MITKIYKDNIKDLKVRWQRQPILPLVQVNIRQILILLVVQWQEVQETMITNMFPYLKKKYNLNLAIVKILVWMQMIG